LTSRLKEFLFWQRVLTLFRARDPHIDKVLEKTLSDHTLLPSNSFSVRTKQLNSFIKHQKISTSTGYSFCAFGHCLNAYENISRLLFSDSFEQHHKIFLGPSFVANSAIATLITLRASQSPNKCDVYISDHLMLKSITHQTADQLSLDDPGLLNQIKLETWSHNRSDYFSPLELDEEVFASIASQYNHKLYVHNRPYVCLFLNDGAFKKESLNLNPNSDRSVDCQQYVDIVHQLIAHGYDVVRIGDSSQAPLRLTSPHYFEYSHSPYKSDLNDLYIVAHCSFLVVGGGGGGANIGDCFSKHTLFIDFPIVRRGLYTPLGVTIPQAYLYNNQAITIQQLLQLTPGGCHNSIALQSHGIKWIPADRDLVFSAVDQFISCIESSTAVIALDTTFQTIQFDYFSQTFPVRIAC
tara:strand:+ start:2467 stop:3693 length:1227 start_codon:yes stop_codon:yes gene_type:complete